VHDFGKSLLSELLNSPEIRRDGDTPIIFIGHSMGGLVIKKACVLANQDPASKSLADRVHGLFFLATPHRGADCATLLKNVLRASTYGSKAFVLDLEPNSGGLQSINDEFRHYSNALELRSFYETIETRFVMSSQLIVNPDSAVLGYHNEESAPLNANHRNICKFDTLLDSNFITFRNSLASMTRSVTQGGMLAMCR
jgi:pimeloyl-ACP methyl ester carboxylesterase